MVDVIVDVEWVREHAADPDVVLVDVRPPHFYAQGHLPGAVNLPLFFLSGPAGGPPPASAFAERLASLGVAPSTHVVAYDEGGSTAAARLFWLLQYFRHQRASVLDGGITAWRRLGFDWEYAPSTPGRAEYPVPRPDASVLATAEDVQAALGSPDAVVVDVRSPAEYLGLQHTAARNGHMPGAMNVDWSATLWRDSEGIARLLPDDETRSLFVDAGATPEKDVIVHCQAGGRSSFAFLVLRHLGYQSVRNYDAGWQEWGNRDDTPVEPA